MQAARERQVRADGEVYVPQGQRTGIGGPSHWSAGERGNPQRQASLVVDPPNGRIPPMTEEGKKRIRPRAQHLLLRLPRCRRRAPVRDVRGPRSVTIAASRAACSHRCCRPRTTWARDHAGPGRGRHSQRDDPRDAHHSGRRPPAHRPNIRSYMGDSRGHWEGDTLVIETTNFNGKVGITRNGNTLLTSADLKLTERFTRVAADTLNYEATVDDPQHVDAAVEGRAAADAASRVPVLRVRVPRRELRDAEHPQRGTGGREGGAREWNDPPGLTLPSTPNSQFPTPKIGYWKLEVGSFGSWIVGSWELEVD